METGVHYSANTITVVISIRCLSDVELTAFNRLQGGKGGGKEDEQERTRELEMA